MVSGRRRIYWETSVWLSYINGVPSRLPVLDTLLADSESTLGDIVIVTSTISMTEVAFGLVEQSNQVLSEEVEANIDSLWSDRRAITLVEYHPIIALEARGLMRTGIPLGWSLKPLDAIHLATAKWFGVIEFHTYDGKLRRYSDQVGFTIVEPYVSGGPPATQPQLPNL